MRLEKKKIKYNIKLIAIHQNLELLILQAVEAFLWGYKQESSIFTIREKIHKEINLSLMYS